jgi:hypothetical protein
MERLKRLCSLRANSLLESVVALSIISVCLYIAIMVYASVFSPKTSVKAYSSQNKVYEVFYLQQIRQDSLLEQYNTDNWQIEEEYSTKKLKKITVHYKDSVQAYPERSFYIANE